MLLSMTGFGRAKKSFRGKDITVEVRSLNSKFTDLRIKIPQNYREKESEIRKIVIDEAQRGKLDLLLDTKSLEGDDEYGLNKALFRKYYTELTELANEVGMANQDVMAAILRLPNVVATDADDIEEEEWQTVLATIDEAMKSFHQFRLTEGQAMEDDLRMRTLSIMTNLRDLDPHEEGRIGRLRQRLHQNLEDHLGKEKVDENRFEQEIIYYLEKIDLTEEKVRLEQHCKYFLEVLDLKNTIKGKKLSFISQEMGREINTLGAKAYSSDIQRLVVTMKDELEKIKEQVANAL